MLLPAARDEIVLRCVYRSWDIAFIQEPEARTCVQRHSENDKERGD